MNSVQVSQGGGGGGRDKKDCDLEVSSEVWKNVKIAKIPNQNFESEFSKALKEFWEVF